MEEAGKLVSGASLRGGGGGATFLLIRYSLGGSGGMPTQKLFCFETASGAIWGDNFDNICFIKLIELT